jgi:hypothetical protein
MIWDRVSGSAVAHPLYQTSWLVQNGRFIVRDDGAGVETPAATRPAPLVVDRRGFLNLDTGGQPLLAHCVGHPLPGDVTVSALADLAMHSGDSVLELLDIVPLLPRSDVDKYDDPRDELVHGAIGALTEIVDRPRTRLRRDHEVVPVGRVRRVTPRSTIHLAAHSELWGRRSLSRVQPSQMLSEVTEVELATYENRLVAEAIHRAYEHVSSRLNRVGDVAQFFERLTDLTRSLENRPFWLRRRLGILLAGIPEPKQNRALTQQLERLVELQPAVGGLLDQRFTHTVPRLGIPQGGVHRTNLIIDDSRYSAAADLLEALNRGHTESDESYEQKSIQLCWDLLTYSLVLTVRALDSHGWFPVDDIEPSRGLTVAFQSEGRYLNVLWDWDDTILLEVDEDSKKRSIRLVPLLQPLGTIQDEAIASDVFDSLEASAHQRPDDLVGILYIRDGKSSATWGPELSERSSAIGNERRTPIRTGFLPVGPLEADAEGRLGRLLGWFSRGWLWEDHYPPRFAADSVVLDRMVDLSGGSITRSEAPGQLLLMSPLEPRSRRAIDDALERAEQRESVRSDQRSDSAKRAREGLQKALGELALLLRCPTVECGGTCPEQQFKHRAASTFWCRCASCGTEWGLRTCGSCHSRYPVLSPPGVHRTPADSSGPWIDQFYGSELVAAPCRATETAFICTGCGACPEWRTGMECVRCDLISRET